MKIAIDANELCMSKIYGVKVYTYNVIKELMALDKYNEYTLYSQHEFFNEDIDRLMESSPNFYHKVIKWNKPFWTYTRFPQELWRDRPDVLFMPIQTVPFLEHSHTTYYDKANIITTLLKPYKLKIITVIHDVAFLKFPQYFKFWDRFALGNNTKRALHLSDLIVAPSEATKSDILKYYLKIKQGDIKVINNGYDTKLYYTRMQTLSDRQILSERFKISKPYLMFVGVIQPRKNITALIKAFKELVSQKKQDIELVIVGNSGWMSEGIYRQIKECGFYNRIRLIENICNRDLAILFRSTEALILPSLYEGFGLPVIEAMGCGAPVIISNISSLPEIGGDAALYIDPSDFRTITEAALKILQDKEYQNLLKQKSLIQSKKFSWHNTAQLLYNEFTNITNIEQ